MILEQFASPLLLLLIAASVISIATGELIDGIIIIVVVLANVIIGTVQEVTAEKSVEALKQINATTAVVIRDGEQQEIPAADLVEGDYVVLEAGRVVPADLSLVQTSSLKLNESALTGESVAVEKDSSEKSNEKTPLGDRKDKAFMAECSKRGQFAKGNRPFNKGKRWKDFMSEEGMRNSAKTQFSGQPHNTRPPGYEMLRTADKKGRR